MVRTTILVNLVVVPISMNVSQPVRFTSYQKDLFCKKSCSGIVVTLCLEKVGFDDTYSSRQHIDCKTTRNIVYNVHQKKEGENFCRR